MAKLSIGIVSLKARTPLLQRLLAELNSQDRFHDIELVIDIDDGNETIGAKRNRVNAQATGQYICHIDDDDLVAHNYIPSVLAAIEANPGVDAVCLRGRRTLTRGRDSFGKVMEFDYRLGCEEGKIIQGIMWRTPGHLCPIRAELVKGLPYKSINKRGEDLLWSAEMAPRLKTTARAGGPSEVLYFYQYDVLKKPGE